MSTEHDLAQAYSEPAFWHKVRSGALRAGYQVMEKALWLYYAFQRPGVPIKIKAIILGALGYFILPADVIPDLLPILGYTDDLAVLAAAVGVVAFYIDDTVKAQASATLLNWFAPGAD